VLATQGHNLYYDSLHRKNVRLVREREAHPKFPNLSGNKNLFVKSSNRGSERVPVRAAAQHRLQVGLVLGSLQSVLARIWLKVRILGVTV